MPYSDRFKDSAKESKPKISVDEAIAALRDHAKGNTKAQHALVTLNAMIEQNEGEKAIRDEGETPGREAARRSSPEGFGSVAPTTAGKARMSSARAGTAPDEGQGQAQRGQETAAA